MLDLGILVKFLVYDSRILFSGAGSNAQYVKSNIPFVLNTAVCNIVRIKFNAELSIIEKV